jgi:hypothetical protein
MLFSSPIFILRQQQQKVHGIILNSFQRWVRLLALFLSAVLQYSGAEKGLSIVSIVKLPTVYRHTVRERKAARVSSFLIQ